MNLTDDERRMLDGQRGEAVARALDYLIQFGDAFGAERFVDVIYAHYPAEMSIYRGNVEDGVEYAETGARVRIPTTTSTLACDLDQWQRVGCPEPVYQLQAQIVPAHRNMGVLGTYTCTPQHLGFIPPKGSFIISVESAAIVYYNSVLGARTNRGGIFTRFSAVTGKYPLTGYLLDENRRGTQLFKIKLQPDDLQSDADYSALGFHVGGLVGSEVPVLDQIGTPDQSNLLALGAALATSGSVTLFHAPGHTAEADSVEQAFGGCKPRETHEVGRKEIEQVYEKLTTIASGSKVDFVTLGCPHYTLDQLRYVADWFQQNKKRVHPDVRLWICTNRMTKQAATWEGVTQQIESGGGLVICDSCPVESHMRLSTCKEFGLKTPQCEAMVTDSCKMARYVGDLLGCQTALRTREQCLQAAVSGKLL
ncbi:MAG: aconitase X [Phycisphaerae bacterium]